MHRTGSGFVRNYSARKKFTPTGCRFRLRYAAGGRQSAPREDAMRQTTMRQTTMRQATMRQASMISALVVMLPFIGPAAHAQTAPQQGPSQQIAPQQGPSQDVLAPAPKLNLTLE